MKRFTLSLLAVAMLFGAVACTAPSQPPTAQALGRFQQYNRMHITDLANLAKQEALNAGYEKAKTDPKAGVEYVANTYEKVGFILVEAEKNNAQLLLVKQYVDAQVGILNLWWDDLKKAWSKSANPTTQPAEVPTTSP